TDQLEIADREDSLTEWLDDHDIDDSWRIAPVLATAGVDVDFCERVAAALPMANPAPAFEWLGATVTIPAPLHEMKDATGRITALVDAVKSYSQLDRASMQLIDVTDGIDTTLVMLRRKLDDVTIERDYGDVPRIEANPAELNQVWTNLFDNAIDA